MRISKYWVPNIFSVSRPIIGIPLFWYVPAGDWMSALVFVIVGIFTDALDGWAAKILNAGTDFGREWVDPICDFTFCAEALLAWSIQRPFEPWRLGLAVTLLAIAAAGKYFKQQKEHRRIHHFVYGALPLYYLSFAWIFLSIYCNNAVHHPGPVTLVAIASAAGFAVAKYERLELWFSHINQALAKNPVAD